MAQEIVEKEAKQDSGSLFDIDPSVLIFICIHDKTHEYIYKLYTGIG